VAGRIALAAGLVARPAAAHHPGDKLDEVMGSTEKYFQAVDKQPPAFSLSDADGRPVALSDFKGKVVVLHFIYANCPDVCPLHADRIAEIQEQVNASAMKGQVQFVSITTDPANDGPEVLRGYGRSTVSMPPTGCS
jgi:protein SCO1/2